MTEFSWVWQHMPEIAAFWRQRQVDIYEFQGWPGLHKNVPGLSLLYNEESKWMESYE